MKRKYFKRGGKALVQITGKVKITITRSLFIGVVDYPAEALYESEKLSKWISSIKERADYLKKYNGTKAVYAYFCENAEESGCVKFEGQKFYLQTNPDKDDTVIYLFSNPKVRAGERLPGLYSFKEFKKIVGKDIIKWPVDIKDEFKINKEGKALLYNNNRSLLGSKKFVMVH